MKVKTLLLIGLFLLPLFPLFASEDQIGLSIGSVGGTYKEPGLELSLGGAVLDMPYYYHIFDNQMILGAQYSSFSLIGTSTVYLADSTGFLWPVSLQLDYNQVILSLVAGYSFDIPSWEAKIQPVVLIGSGSATLTVTASLLSFSESESYSGTAGMIGFEVPIYWYNEGKAFYQGVKLGAYSSGTNLAFTDGSTGKIRVNSSLSYSLGWKF